MTVENLIIGENFKPYCNVVIDFQTYNQPRYYKNNNVVFCKTDFLIPFFNEIRNFNISIILITHQSDYEINEQIFSHKPPCIKKWFAQNVNYRHPDLIPLPIGLENHKGFSKGSYIDIEYLEKLQPNFTSLNKNLDKVYSNFGNTHKNRENVRNILKSKEMSYEDAFGQPFAKYMKSMSDFLFVASPRGNGIDCHRTWEALLMGCVPIVEKHFMYDDYNLPIIQIDSWEELNYDMLETYKNRYLNQELFTDISQLSMKYWIDRIGQEFKKIQN